MLKGKPFLITSLVFGGLGLIVLILTVISFFCGDNLISAAIGELIHMGTDSFNDATMGQIAVVFFIPAFIFAFRSFADNDDTESSDEDSRTAIDSAVVTESAVSAEGAVSVRHAIVIGTSTVADDAAQNSDAVKTDSDAADGEAVTENSSET